MKSLITALALCLGLGVVGTTSTADADRRVQRVSGQRVSPGHRAPARVQGTRVAPAQRGNYYRGNRGGTQVVRGVRTAPPRYYAPSRNYVRPRYHYDYSYGYYYSPYYRPAPVYYYNTQPQAVWVEGYWAPSGASWIWIDGYWSY